MALLSFIPHISLAPRRKCRTSCYSRSICSATATEREAEVIIVGAGLSGLAAAKRLGEDGLTVRVLESSDGVGGRVRTDHVDGYVLDRGFQVFIEAYPEQRRILDYDKLELQRMLPGALVRFDDAFHSVSDPFRAPFLAAQGLFSPVGSLTDKLNVLRLRAHLLSRSPDTLLQELHGETTLSFLRRFGFSASMIDRFFTPFYQGIFLAPLAEQNASMFAYVFHMFATAPASLPRHGIGAVSDQLAACLPSNVHVELGRKVTAVRDGTLDYLCVDDNTMHTASAPVTIVATDGPAAVRLLAPNIETAASRGSICVYFSSARPPPIDRPILALNGAVGTDSADTVTVNNMFFPSAVSASFAPTGRTLISTTVVGAARDASNEEVEERVRKEMENWYGREAVDEWKRLRMYRIPHSQSAQEKAQNTGVKIRDGLYVCGDHRSAPTVNGALRSGNDAAVAALNYLRD